MEDFDFEFDIEEVLEHLEGLNVIEKCQALDNLSDCLSNSLENAINEISDAQDRINDEYECLSWCLTQNNYNTKNARNFLSCKSFRAFVVAEAGFKSTLPPSVTC